MSYEYHRPIVLKNCLVIEKDNGVSGLMTSGEFALNGVKGMPNESKSVIIIE